MPRCYMVKKYYPTLSRSPPCSPPEACVAPPCYYPQEDHSTQTDRGREGGDRCDGKKAESGGNWFKTAHADSDDDLTDSEVEGYGKKMEKIGNTGGGGKIVYDEDVTNFGLLLDMSLNVIDDDDTNDRLIVDESKLVYEDDDTRDGLVIDESKSVDDKNSRDKVVADDIRDIDEDARDGFTMDEIKNVVKDMATQDNLTIKEDKKYCNIKEHQGIIEEGNKIYEKKQHRSVVESQDEEMKCNNVNEDITKNANNDVSESSYEVLMIDDGNNFDEDDELDFGLTVIEDQHMNEDVEIELGLREKDKVGKTEKIDKATQAENSLLSNPSDVQNTMEGEKKSEGDENENNTRGVSGSVKYAELGVTPLSERSAADTEAAHELLSLAAGVPPLPPAAVVTMIEPEPQPMISVPLYTYAVPTNIFILADDPPDPIYHTVQAVSPMPQVNYATIDQQRSYIAYQEAPVPCAGVPMDYQPLYRECIPQPVVVQPVVMEPIAVPVSVIESTPMVHPVSIVEPVSVQVPVIEMVPQVQQHPTPPVQSVNETVPLPKLPEERKRRTRIENQGKFDCNECGKRYATSSNLSRHKQTHRSLDSVAAKRCGECGKAYVSMPALAMHVLTHRMGHVCGVCGKQFSRPWLLRGHLRSHTGEKPYRCLSCNKAFADRSNLRAHLQTHSADKKFECNRCNKNFALKSYLSKHQESACVREDDQ